MENYELSQYLASLENAGEYRVLRVLKQSEVEETALVAQRPDAAQENQPEEPGQLFIRKVIARPFGENSLYQDLFALQAQGTELPRCLPRLYECYLTESSLVVVMEYIQGESVEQIVKQRGASPELALELFPEICSAASQLHRFYETPIIHRDLKPSNIIISPERTTLIDLGISRWYKEGGTGDTTRFGTREYAPPEQYGYRQTDERSDVYALGMLLYYLACGWTPDISLVQEGFKNEDLSPILRNVIVRATQFDPGQRYQSAWELCVAAVHALRNPSEEPFSLQIGKPTPQSPPAAPAAPTTPAAPDKPAAKMTISGFLGRVWNAILTFTFFMTLIICIYCIAKPPESMQQYPLWVNAISYLLVAFGLFGPVCYALLDRRRLRKRYAFMEKHTLRRDIIPCVIIFVVSFVIIGLLNMTKIG